MTGRIQLSKLKMVRKQNKEMHSKWEQNCVNFSCSLNSNLIKFHYVRHVVFLLQLLLSL